MIDRRRFIGIGAAAGLLTGREIDRAFAADAKAVPGPTVVTNAGKVRGLQLDKVAAFKGVAYGASTAPPNRFLPPSPPKPWTGVRDAWELGNRSPQLPESFHGFVPPEVEVMDRDEAMSEDCLRLNVWTPAVGPGKRPVMVWLHGGGFTSGSGGFVCYDGGQLARKHNVVAITVNHRLSVFGYLYLAGLGGEHYANASNVGNLDIVLALEWVRDNIAAFGGDSGNVTIFGQSGGGGKVSTLLSMPAAKGLFHRAIVQSGASLRALPLEAADRSTKAYLAALKLEPAQIDRLQSLTVDQLLAPTKTGGPPLALAPVMDGHSLPRHPFDPTAPEISAGVPLLLGTVETEVTFFPNQILDPIDEANLLKRVKEQLGKATDEQVRQLVAVYRKGRPQASNTDLFLIIASDASFRASTNLMAERKAAQGRGAVYQYYFTWRSPVREGKLRSFHTVEIPFVFDNVDGAKSMTGSGTDRYVLADKMSAAWAAFAYSGNPNHSGLPAWTAFDAGTRATMIFDDDCKVVNDPHGAEQSLLRSILAGA